MPPVEGYCVRCQAKRELTDTSQTHRSGLPAIAGKCTVCGSNMFVLGAGAPPLPDEGSEP